MRRRSLAPLCLLALTTALAACGGDDEGGAKTFEDSAYDITFEYPEELTLRNDPTVSSSAGGEAKERKALALDEDNLILVEKYGPLRVDVNEDNLEQVKGELDGVVGQATGETVSGKKTEAGGLPGYEYTVKLDKPAGGESRLVFLFKDKFEYELNCQYTDKGREKIREACDQALETLKPKEA